jgi:general stress protein YciG
MAGNGKSRRGFASMDPSRQREIASKGGRAAHAKGTAHEWSSDEARVAGRKGGEVVSRDRAHMAAIGREGGEARGANARAARSSRFSDSAGQGMAANESSRGGSPMMDRELSLNVTREGMGDRTERSDERRPGATRPDSDVGLGANSQPRDADESSAR